MSRTDAPRLATVAVTRTQLTRTRCGVLDKIPIISFAVRVRRHAFLVGSRVTLAATPMATTILAVCAPVVAFVTQRNLPNVTKLGTHAASLVRVGRLAKLAVTRTGAWHPRTTCLLFVLTACALSAVRRASRVAATHQTPRATANWAAGSQTTRVRSQEVAPGNARENAISCIALPRPTILTTAPRVSGPSIRRLAMCTFVPRRVPMSIAREIVARRSGTSTANVSATIGDVLSVLPVCLADRDIVQRIARRCCPGTKFWACNAAPTELIWS